MWRNTYLILSCKTSLSYNATYLPEDSSRMFSPSPSPSFRKLWVIYMSRNASFIQFITSIFGIISQYAVRQITNQPHGCLRKAKLVLIFDGSALHLCYSNLFLQLFCQISNLYGIEWFITAWTLLLAPCWCLTCCNITGVPFIVLIFILQYVSLYQWLSWWFLLKHKKLSKGNYAVGECCWGYNVNCWENNSVGYLTKIEGGDFYQLLANQLLITII